MRNTIVMRENQENEILGEKSTKAEGNQPIKEKENKSTEEEEEKNQNPKQEENQTDQKVISQDVKNTPENESNPISFSSSIIFAFDWNGYDALSLMILIGIGVFSRFWVIQYPRHFVGDEAIYIGQINSYINGSYFIGTQPPLATMVMAAIAYLSDYKQQFKPPIHEYNYSYPSMEYVTLRSTPAYFATFLIPLSFFIVRLFGSSRLTALASGIFTLCDFLLIGMGRHIYPDGIVHAFVAFSVFFSALLIHFRPYSFTWWLLLILESIFTGFSVSSSFSAFGLFIYIFIFTIYSISKQQSGKIQITKQVIFVGFIIVIITFSIFFVSFCFHVLYLPYSSAASLHSSSFIKENSETITSLIQPGQPYLINHLTIPKRAIENIFATYKALSSKKDFSGKWYKWPIMNVDWVLLWTDVGRYVGIFGNIAFWWPAFFCCIYSSIKTIVQRTFNRYYVFLTLGWITSLGYFAFGPSEHGLCDYALADVFSIWVLCLMVDEMSETVGGFIITGLICLSIFVFILWAPVLYGYENIDTRFLPNFVKLVKKI